ncbi:Uma2 family endonuclease [Pseudanabaena sp. FACHB-1998]|uniref:Uma2 family endonuclease n=1 Tax=Pseudanabaena sp. FACHB-1998 TaxID=2692858 RepID=UPI0016815E32|nr:Uma2 family endonuclease [Pseudanabaena sp. FACHB-1998]MBD2176219.1 Uma2 family endonuclease [Pseudanabaena sp. FACHB-1998]
MAIASEQPKNIEITGSLSTNSLSIEEFLALPETKPASEYIDGQIYQKPMPQGQHSTFQAEIVTSINLIGKPQKLAFAFPELRCNFAGISIVPDIAVMRWTNIPFLPNKRVANQILVSPDWIIEILSPDQSPLRVMSKISSAITNGSELGWLISPAQDFIMVFQGDRFPEKMSGKDVLPVLNVLNWQVTVDDVFNLLCLE